MTPDDASSGPMPADNGPSPVQQCLQQFQALQEEMDVAIQAIAHNALADFEHSLWQQEMLSTNLRRSLFLVAGTPLTTASRRELTAAGEALQLKTQSYKALIDQAGHAAALLQGVCSLYQLAPSSLLGTGPMLSCEA